MLGAYEQGLLNSSLVSNHRATSGGPVPQSSVSMGGQSSSVTLECDCLAHRFGNAADNGFRQARYPTDMTDAEWAVVRLLLPVPGWMRGRGGQPEAYCHRAIGCRTGW